jgi:hypothetical protein
MEATMKESLDTESTGKEEPGPATELLQVPGLGPKRVRILHGAGVQSLAELRAAAQERRLRCVPGFSAALEENILRAVTAHFDLQTRRPAAVPREQLWARRNSRDDRRGGQAHAASAASPTSWMRSIWRSRAE